ncbi:hypothetical protein [Oceanobacillus alkalisoli]|uniref:hypothetical protein n=1 Tax=Oceanobacillus alkalisoli TaxID=2925113 RepID=UPI001EE4D0BC|nr:hypothetical protein [Oceanobacillus alkalisoli]MCG5103756.1 hypothetical protein [Oceanobacillus alkalisoli]
MNPIPHQPKQNQPKIRFNLKAKMIALISILIISIFIVFSFFLHTFISNTTEDQVGKRALHVAKTVSTIPELRKTFQSENPAAMIQEIVVPIQEEKEAEFIVIGNTESVRYFHPGRLPPILSNRLPYDFLYNQLFFISRS